MEQPRVLVAITSYNRFNSLCDLTFKLLQNDNVDIAIFDDCSDFDIDRFGADDLDIYIRGKAERLPKGRMTVVKNPEHRGKAGFWNTYNDIFAYCKEHDYDYYIILPDDVEPCPDFIDKAIKAYNDCGGICISPLLTNRSLLPGISRWGRKPIERKEGYYLTHYFDCCTVCRRDFFEALHWLLAPIAPHPDPHRSSGVGRQITLRLQEQGKRMCHVERTLLTIVQSDSQMNPEERKRHPMVANYEDNYRCVDVHMASLYRDGHLLKTLQTIARQPEVATVYVTLNNYTQPQYNETLAGIKSLIAETGCKIVTRRAKNQKGSNEKLSQLPKSTAPYIAFCDDDMLYPDDYFLRLIHGIRLHNAAVSFHGGRLKRFPIVKYYNGDRQMFSWNISVAEDTQVDILGNCFVMVKREWLTDAEWKALYTNATAVSMDDIYLSCVLSQKGIERWVLAHPSGFAHHKEQAPEDNYVYDRYKNDDAAQVKYINEHLKR